MILLKTFKSLDMLDFLHIVFCACDEDFNGNLNHTELTTDVCKIILDHEVEQEHFDMVDVNGDGEVSLDEVLEWAMSNEYMKKRSATYKDRMFSENGNIPVSKLIYISISLAV